MHVQNKMDTQASKHDKLKPSPPPVAPKPKRTKTQSITMATERDNDGYETYIVQDDPTNVASDTKTVGAMDPLDTKTGDTDVTVIDKRESAEPTYDIPKSHQSPKLSPDGRSLFTDTVQADVDRNGTHTTVDTREKKKDPKEKTYEDMAAFQKALKDSKDETAQLMHDAPKPCPSSISPKPLLVHKKQTHSKLSSEGRPLFTDTEVDTSEKNKDPKEETYEDMATFQKALGTSNNDTSQFIYDTPKPCPSSISPKPLSLNEKETHSKLSLEGRPLFTDTEVDTREKKKDPKERTYIDMAALRREMTESGMPEESTQPPPLPPRPTKVETTEGSAQMQTIQLDSDDTNANTLFNANELDTVDSEVNKQDQGLPDPPPRPPPPLPPRPTTEVPSQSDLQAQVLLPTRHTYGARKDDPFNSTYIDMNVLKETGKVHPDAQDDDVNQDNTILTTQELTDEKRHAMAFGARADAEEMLPPPPACKRTSDDFIETDISTAPDVPLAFEAEQRYKTPPNQNVDQPQKDKLVNDRGGSGGSGYFSSEDTTGVAKRNLLQQQNNMESVIIYGILQNNTKEEVEKLLGQAGVDLEDVKSIHVDHFERIIQFHDADDCLKWSTLDLSDGEYPLKVSHHYLEEDPYKAFITGFPPITTKESLKDYLQEPPIHITDIQMGDIPHTAMVTFRSPKDMKKIKSKCETQPMDKQLPKAYPVKIPNTIKIFTDKEHPVVFNDIREYRTKFCKETRHQDEIVWDDKMKCYIVKLKDFEEVKSMCEDGAMTAAPGYCLGFDPTTLHMPEPIELQGESKHFTLFANDSSVYKEAFNELLKRTNGFLWRTSSDKCFILCTVDYMEPMAKQKLKHWETECLKAVEGFIKKFTLKPVHVAEECWTKVVELFSGWKAQGSHVSVNDLSQEDYSFVLVGESDFISKIVDTITVLEKELQKVTRKKKMKPYQYELLMEAVEKKKGKKSSAPPTEADQTHTVYFEGTYKETTQGIDDLYAILKKIEDDTEKGYDDMSKELLKTDQMSTYIKSKMRKENLIATYAVTDSDVCVYVYPTNKNSLKRASEILISSINMKQLRLKENNVKGSEEWTMRLLELRTKHADWFRVELTNNEMKLVCGDSHFDEVYSELLEVLDLFTTINSFFEIDIGKWRFIEANQKDEIVAIKTKCSDANVVLIESDTPERMGFTLRGKKGDCKSVIPLLQNLVDQVYHHSFQLSNPSFCELVQREDCIQELLMIELISKCGLHVGTDSKELPCQPIERARTPFCRRDIVITEGDITDMIVDGLVNPVDCSLQNMTGVGAAIVEKEGYNFQLKSDQYIRTRGEMVPGGVVFWDCTTDSRKGIISVAVPFWTSDMSDANKLLELAVQNSLQEAVEKNYVTVAIPSLDSSFNYPIEDSTLCMVKAVADFLCSKLSPGSSLMTVYLCGSTIQHCNAFEIALKSTSAKGFRSSTIERHIKVDVIKGELANTEADAIVVPTTPDLNLGVGRLSRSLLMTAGDELQQECLKAYPQGIHLGQVGITSGANMKCKCVLYGRLEKWDDGKGYAEKVMGVFIENCLSEASRMGLASIAFPALGTGNLGFEPAYIADLILDCVYTFKLKNAPTSLKIVYLVVYPSDQNTLKIFEDTLSDAQQSVGKPTGRYRSYSPMFFEKGTRFLKTFGNISVEVVPGNITKEKTYAIVNSISSLNLDSGFVSRAIFNAAGPTIQMECHKQENRNAMNKHGFVETGSGNLDFCKKIIHLAAKDTKSEWKSAIRSCLEAANSQGYNSISFPALGTGGRGCTPSMIADAMFSEISKFSGSCKGQQSLRRIRIVIYNQDMMKFFVKEAKKDPSIRRSIFAKPKKEKQAVTFHLYGQTPSQLFQTETMLLDLFHSETIKIGNNSLVREYLEKIVNKHNVLTDFGKNEIHVHGLKRPVLAAKEEIQKYLASMQP